jgi:NAD(P)H-flavin reductase
MAGTKFEYQRRYHHLFSEYVVVFFLGKIMAKVIKKELLTPNTWRYRILAPRIAKNRKAGQFIILRPGVDGERIPLTMANGNAAEGWIEIIFQVVGKTTALLAQIGEGEEISDLAGPLGRPTHLEKFGNCVLIGGGVGIAPLYPIVRAFHETGNTVTSILGARNKDLLILTDEIAALSDRTLIATDDGSRGFHGFVSGVLQELLDKGEKFDACVVIGPVPMMKVTSAVAVKAGIRTLVSLNPIMIDGTGMCGGCRVTIGEATKFACVDGPEFDAALVDWDGLIKRLGAYRETEQVQFEQHKCHLQAVK